MLINKMQSYTFLSKQQNKMRHPPHNQLTYSPINRPLSSPYYSAATSTTVATVLHLHQTLSLHQECTNRSLALCSPHTIIHAPAIRTICIIRREKNHRVSIRVIDCRPVGAWMMGMVLIARGSATLHPWLSAAVPSGDLVIAQNASVKSILLE